MNYTISCKTGPFRYLLETIKELETDVNFQITKEGLSLQCMDRNHVALVSLNIPAKSFEKFKCKVDTVIGVNLDTFLTIIKCASGPKDDLVIEPIVGGGDDIVCIKLVGEERNLSYEMKLMDIDSNPLKIPARDNDVVLQMNSSTYKQIFADMIKLGSEVVIKPHKDRVYFEVRSDQGVGNFDLEYTDDNCKNVELNEEIDQKLALKYLNHFAKACTFCKKVELRMKDENPLIVEFQLPRMSSCLIDPDDNFGSILFFLAPKIGDD